MTSREFRREWMDAEDAAGRKITLREVADKCGKSAAWVCEKRQRERVPDDLVDALRSVASGATNAEVTIS